MKKILLVCLIAICFLSSCGVESSNGIYFNKVKDYATSSKRRVEPYWVEREEFMKYYSVDLPVEIEDDWVSVEGHSICYPVKGSKQKYVEFILEYNFELNGLELTPTTLENGWISYLDFSDTRLSSDDFDILISDHRYISNISFLCGSEETSIIKGVEMHLYDLREWDRDKRDYYYSEFKINNLFITYSSRGYSGDKVVGMLDKIVSNSGSVTK